MDTSDDDEDLKRAIALSLKDQDSTSSKPNEVINLDSDDGTTADEGSLPPPQMIEANTDPKPLHSMLGLDRKAMEQERLARKRKASLSPPPSRKAVKLAQSALDKNTDGDFLRGTSNVGIETVSSSTQTANKSATLSNPASAPTRSDLKGLSFPTGAVKKTWAFNHPRQSSDIKIEEVLQRHDLTLAVLSSFQWDVEWLLRKVSASTTQLVFVMQAKEESTKRQYERETADMPNLRLCFPSMEGQINCMHSKLMLLSHPGYLRVVVPTANLVPYDWGETGVMENSLFLVDLPRLPASANTSNAEMTPFGDDLIYFLKAMSLDPKIVQSIYNFDFSATRNLAFVHTIGGAHAGDAWRRTGYCGLGRAVKQLNLQTEHELKLDFVASSIGSLNYDFLSALYLATQGDDGLTEYERRNEVQSKSKAGNFARMKAKDKREELIMVIRENFRIYFPTHETVARSTGGTDCGGTICFQSKWYTSPGFPKELMRDCKSVRKGMLMHNKVRVPPKASHAFHILK